jgi:hypothetical protein
LLSTALKVAPELVLRLVELLMFFETVWGFEEFFTALMLARQNILLPSIVLLRMGF